MAQEHIVIGPANEGGGDTPFAAWTKAENNFTELYNAPGTTSWNVSGNTTVTTPTISGIPTFIGSVIVRTDTLGVTQIDNSGLRLHNTTAAAAGAQQISPALRLTGNGWKTSATAQSQPVDWVFDVLPVQGSGAPTSQLRIINKVNSVTQTTGTITLNSDGARLASLSNGLKIETLSGAPGGISLNGAAPVSDQIIMTPGSFLITTTGAWSSAGTGITLSPGPSITATSGTQTGVGFSGNFIPTSGTANFNVWGFFSTINQTGGANGAVSIISITPTYTAAGGNVALLTYNPTIGSISGAHYGMLVAPIACLNSFGAGLTPTAMVHIGAGAETRAQVKLDSSTVLTTPVPGVMEYDGTNLFFTRTGTTRESVICSNAVNNVSPILPNRTITVIIAGTTYYIHAKTTND